MYRRLVLTVITAISLSGLFALYSIAMRPVVKIPTEIKAPIESVQSNSYDLPDENRRIAATYLPEWAAKSQLGLHADSAFIYTNDWMKVESNNKRIQFTPFAMAWLTTDNEGKESAVTIASSSAVVEFEQSLDENFNNPGRVIKAIFNDDVRIEGPNGLYVTGQNFIYDETTLLLWTSYPVEFGFQSHKGLATRMEMKLIPSGGVPGSDRPHVYGIETITLKGGPNPQKPERPYVLLTSQMPQGREIVPVKMRCHGDLTLSVVHYFAILQDDVRVWTGTKDNFTELNCQKLTIQLTPKQSPVASTAENSPQTPKSISPAGNEYQSFYRELELLWFHAEGLRDGDRVKIRSPKNAFKVNVTKLIYWALEGRLLMISQNPEKKVIALSQDGLNLRANSIDAYFHPDNSLKSMICQGEGEFVSEDTKTKKLDIVAAWQTHLSLTKDEASKLQLVELKDGAQFRQPGRATRLNADLIKVWLDQIDLKFDAITSNPPKGQNSRSQKPDPKRLHADGKVTLSSPQLIVDQTKELDVEFETNTVAAVNTTYSIPQSQFQTTSMIADRGLPADRSGALVLPVVPSKSISVNYQQIGFANVDEERIESGSELLENPPDLNVHKKKQLTSGPAPSAPPIHLSADSIRAMIRRNTIDEKIELGNVFAAGHLTMWRNGNVGEKVLAMSGDSVEVKSKSENKAVIHLLGSPAIIDSATMRLEGKDMILDRESNRALVTGAGSMRIPVPDKVKVPGQDVGVNRELNVIWKESMDFNGIEAKFIGKVRSKMALLSVECEQMFVKLANRVSFDSNSEVAETQPELESIRCQENVAFKNKNYELKKLVGNYSGKFGELTYYDSTGDVKALGPGRLEIWQRRLKDSENVATQVSMQANRPIPVAVSLMDYTRIDFQGQLDGRIDGRNAARSSRQRITIEDEVRIVHGPVNSATETVDPDKLPVMGGTMRCKRLEMVKHEKSKQTLESYFELIGTGDSEIEGRVKEDQYYTASADEVSYDGSTDRFLLRSHGKRKSRVNGSMYNQNGQLMKFWPKIPRLEVVGATETNGSY